MPRLHLVPPVGEGLFDLAGPEVQEFQVATGGLLPFLGWEWCRLTGLCGPGRLQRRMPAPLPREVTVVEVEPVGAHVGQLKQAGQHHLPIGAGEIQMRPPAGMGDRLAFRRAADPVGIADGQGLLCCVPVVGDDLQALVVGLVDDRGSNVLPRLQDDAIDVARVIRVWAAVIVDRQRGRPPGILVGGLDVAGEGARTQSPEARSGLGELGRAIPKAGWWPQDEPGVALDSVGVKPSRQPGAPGCSLLCISCHRGSWSVSWRACQG
jgi:hypothetical protein